MCVFILNLTDGCVYFSIGLERGSQSDGHRIKTHLKFKITEITFDIFIKGENHQDRDRDGWQTSQFDSIRWFLHLDI